MSGSDKLTRALDVAGNGLTALHSGEAKTEYEVLQLMRQCAAQFDFSHFMIARVPFGEQHRFSERLVLSSWPAKLVRDYDVSGIFQLSLLVERLRHTKLPVFSSTASLLAEVSGLSGPQMTGLVTGESMESTFAALFHTTFGEAFIIALSGGRNEPAGREAAELYFTLLRHFETLEKTFDPGASPRDRLSMREIECLRWAAAGKSSDEIAIILGISVYTVSSYFKTATKKLDSVNRMQAIARAMRLKLI